MIAEQLVAGFYLVVLNELFVLFCCALLLQMVFGCLLLGLLCFDCVL